MTDQPERRKLPSSSSLAEAVGAVFNLGDETFAQLVRTAKSVQQVTDVLNHLLQEAKTLKGNDANTLSELTLLRDQADTFSQDLASLQHAVEAHGDTITERSTREMHILGSVVETLLDVSDSLESLKASVVGLNTFVKDHPCPWAKDTGGLSPEARIAAIESILKLLPTLDIVLKKALDREGFLIPKPGDPPEEKYWLRKLIDRFRDALVAAVFSTVASGAVTWAAWTYYFGSKSIVAKAQQEAKTEMMHKLEASEQTRRELEQRLQEALEQAKRPGKRQAP